MSLSIPSLDSLSVFDRMDPEVSLIFADDVPEQGTREQIKKSLDEKMILARKYGFAEYADEIANLMEMLNKVSGRVRS